jgi:hypothetical protein
MDATFSGDGKNIVAALHDGTLEVFDARWTTERGSDLAKHVCEVKLSNAKSLTYDDSLVPLLSQYSAVNPCERTGALLAILNSLQYAANYIIRMSLGRFFENQETMEPVKSVD